VLCVFAQEALPQELDALLIRLEEFDLDIHESEQGFEFDQVLVGLVAR